MALDRDKLADTLFENFDTAKIEEWDERMAADALADAIAEYVLGAKVEGITVIVTNPAGVVIGTGTQETAVSLT